LVLSGLHEIVAFKERKEILSSLSVRLPYIVIPSDISSASSKDISGDVIQRFGFDGGETALPPKPAVIANVEPMPRSQRDPLYNFIGI
jgi:hypothetical protein